MKFLPPLPSPTLCALSLSVIAAGLVALPTSGRAATPLSALDVPQWPSDGICGRLSDAALPGVDGEDRDAVSAFYAARDCRPVWLDQTGLTRAAALAIAELKQAGDWGLDDNDFAMPRLAEMLRGPMPAPLQTVAAADLEVTGAVLRYARQARGGRIPDPASQLTTYLDRKPDLPDPAAVLASITVDPDPAAALRAYQPKQEQFLRLKALLKSLRSRQEEQAAVVVPLGGPALRSGIRHADVVALRRRLRVAAAAGEEDLFTDDLTSALKRFQAAQGLRADGIAGKATRRAFNADGPRGLDQVIANMEAWRWMPADLGERHVLINVPAYAITLYNHGVAEFSERVIVGERDKQTPIFSMAMKSVVLRPEWYLPDSIKLSKLLASRGRSLEAQGYVIKKNGRRVDSRSVDWGRANLSAYSIYQPSGDENALGSVKFLFPNKHSVYMHDTPKRSLFEASERLFSHGCVRVRNPLALASMVLDEDKGAGVFDVPRLVRKGPHNNEVALDHELPVHIGYFTVWVADDGTPTYLKDPYGHEKRIKLALAKQWSRIDKGKDHLAAVDTSGLRALGQPAVATDDSLPATWSLFGPMGVTSTLPPPKSGAPKYKYRRSGDSVGDLIGRSLGQF